MQDKWRRWALIAAVGLALLCTLWAHAGPTGASKHVRVELLPEAEWVQPGEPFWVGFHLKMEPEWHTYWLNPGDSGLPTRMRWELPEGFRAEPFEWPTPEAIAAPPLMSYGYEGEVLLLNRVVPPADLQPGGEVTLGGRLDWLECKEACLPGRAPLDVTLPVRAEPAPRARLPGDGSSWKPQAHVGAQVVALSFHAPLEPRRAYFFPESKDVIEYAAPQKLLRTADGYRLELAPSSNPAPAETLAGVLTVEGDGGSLAVRVQARPETLTAALPAGTPIVAGAAGAEAGGLAVPLALLLAFVGGLILNLMPCVLPVLSLKVLSFVRHAGGGHGKPWLHGAAYTVGVLISFWLLAGLLLLLRAGGQQVGWGFQLQSPPFVAFMACLFFVIGLNLFGVFEVGVSLTAAGGGAPRSGFAGSFAGGALATLVATPCTAPFMGSALGYGLSQPPAVSLAIFTALGLGMALPYLVLSLAPGLVRFVPKPGRWMETFKQLMGFFMMGTVVVLVWVFGQQAGNDGVTALLAGLVLLALAAWIYGRGTAPEASTRQRRVAYALSIPLVVAGLVVGFAQARPAAVAAGAGAAAAEDGIAWQTWSPEKVAAARAEGRPVFIDFTAAWCLTCQVNERVALGSAEVRERFRSEGIVAFKADWTRRDDGITRALESYGRSGVPVYVLYGRGRDEPYLLPEVLSPGLVLSALDSQLR